MASEIGGTRGNQSSAHEGTAPKAAVTVTALRFLAYSAAAVCLLFVFNNYLIFWRHWPGFLNFLGHLGFFGLRPPAQPLQGGGVMLGWLQVGLYVVPIVAIALAVVKTPGRSLAADSEVLAGLAAYIVRGAFWAVLLIGAGDMIISLLRVEGFLVQTVGADLARDLGRSQFRGAYVHYPLMALGMLIGLFTRTLGFTWLALLIVLAELQIVITRFVFSYEQAYMGDLVRFWYASLFLFASAHTLIEEGHVRVDILYAGFSERGKAWANTAGTVLLGMPVCWIILTRGLWGKSNLINAPMLNYEVTQSGYGMYVKYIMAMFLVVYAVSMMVQFAGYFLSNVAVLVGETRPRPPAEKHPL